MNIKGKRRIGALSARQGGLFAEAPSKSCSGSSPSSSSYLFRLLQSRTSSGALAGRTNGVKTAAAATNDNHIVNSNDSFMSARDRRPKPSTSLLGSTFRDGRMAASMTQEQQRHGENRPIAVKSGQRMQKRPRKPIDAYQYFFREQCWELSKLESSGGGGADDTCGMTGSNKRRKSPTGEAIHLKIDIGKNVAKQWRELSPAQRQEYEDLAEKDAERFRKEAEEFYLRPDARGAAAAGMPRATTGRLAAVIAASSSSSSSSSKRASNRLLIGSTSGKSIALTAVNNALSTTSTTTRSTALASTNKTSLQSLLHERRIQLLDDLSSLNQITSSRLSAGRPALSGPIDPAVRQRLYHLSTGPGSGSGNSGRPSPWGKAIRSSNTASSCLTLTAMATPTSTLSPPLAGRKSNFSSLKLPPPVLSDGPTIEILN